MTRTILLLGAMVGAALLAASEARALAMLDEARSTVQTTPEPIGFKRHSAHGSAHHHLRGARSFGGQHLRGDSLMRKGFVAPRHFAARHFRARERSVGRAFGFGKRFPGGVVIVGKGFDGPRLSFGKRATGPALVGKGVVAPPFLAGQHFGDLRIVVPKRLLGPRFFAGKRVIVRKGSLGRKFFAGRSFRHWRPSPPVLRPLHR